MPDFAHNEATARRSLDVIDQLLAARDRTASGVGGIDFLREHEAVSVFNGTTDRVTPVRSR
ncbi:hypothetical protein ACFY93_20945 [Streptomyces sp. NPDC008313]|uniref:hypothetical protein n=1 Tax=Streptomyces sp. NPDC008313 TaxID=3364826 RepID=UPI0036EFF53A